MKTNLEPSVMSDEANDSRPASDEAVVCKELLGESWTIDDLWDARHCLMAIYEGVAVNLTADRMVELAKRGLVYDITRLPGRGRYAKRFTFQRHDKLEELVRAAQAAGVYSPNDKVRHRQETHHNKKGS